MKQHIRTNKKKQKKQELFNTKTTTDKAFKLKNEYVHSLSELIQKLKTITYEDFKKHVNEEKNDFANWIQHVFELDQLSEKIRTCITQEDLIKTLEEHE